jgi:hypothetical protein
MNITQIEQNLKDLIDSFDKDEFIYDLLLAYGKPESSIKRLRGNLNLSNVEGEVSWKRHLLFKEERNADLHLTITELVKSIKNDQRFVIVTDYVTLLAVDIKTLDKLDIKLTDLPKHYDFFLPWAGMEKTQYQDEHPADVKAAEKMAKLFDRVKEDNPDDSPEFIHGLNVFLSRLLFCFFAEDTNIFTENQFTSAISSHTQVDGSDLHNYLQKLFIVLSTAEADRGSLPAYLKEFPYVDGELFSKEHQVPVFTSKSRKAIIDSGTLDWSSINPDIFGSMFQAVVDEGDRSSFGMHYTSVPNIMKVIKPLFLDDLYVELKKSIGNNKKLIKLADRLRKIKIFDPACGSGNFLIIAFKVLKRLEMEIFKELNSFNFSQITPSQFYGIEIDDFAHEIAKLSLWLTEHQMNIEFFDEFQRVIPTLPLKKAGNITCANATRIDWEEVCPKEQNDEIYVLGNPTYRGSSKQNEIQKEDLKVVCNGRLQSYKNLDYISCWFIKAADYIKEFNIEYSFVSTNSISQGEQVGLLWPYIVKNKLEISFAYQSFKWTNNAKSKAAVIVVIIGIRNVKKGLKFIINNGIKQETKNINPYLMPGESLFLYRRSNPLSNFQRMVKGNYATDDGNLILNEVDKNYLINKYPDSKRLIKKYIGSQEYIKGIDRWCLWIDNTELNFANSIKEIKSRIDKVSVFRQNSRAATTREKSTTGHRFIQIQSEPKRALIVPSVSSFNRDYIPVGFVEEDTVVNAQCLVVYEPDTYIMSIITSRMHMAWVRTVAGKLKSDYRYSSALCYYCFPFPDISDNQKQVLTQYALDIIGEREKHPEKTLAQLYDPDKMPDGLREAHHKNDLAIERCYRSKPFENDEERLEYLFKLYEKMIAEEEAK